MLLNRKRKACEDLHSILKIDAGDKVACRRLYSVAKLSGDIEEARKHLLVLEDKDYVTGELKVLDKVSSLIDLFNLRISSSESEDVLQIATKILSYCPDLTKIKVKTLKSLFNASKYSLLLSWAKSNLSEEEKNLDSVLEILSKSLYCLGN